VNKPVDSNCYILSYSEHRLCIVVDPGSKDSGELFYILDHLSLTPAFIILTHEHFDHIWGVQSIKEKYPLCKIIANEKCAEKIVHKKKNMSVFYDQVGFEAPAADIVLKTKDRFRFWDLFEIDFLESKGHSDASMCFYLGTDLFVGDVMIKGHRTSTRFPNGSKKDLEESLTRIFEMFDHTSTRILSGHGEPFQLCDVSLKEFL
jgi:glyoxylase-like metal-dependent hydrolase (beta-lactamase superfamily II)